VSNERRNIILCLILFLLLISLVVLVSSKIKEGAMEKKVNINIRGLSLEVKKKLRAKAGAEDKSMNQLIVEILTEWAEEGDG
jgi:predicted HicB family RNase H-like nuclease